MEPMIIGFMMEEPKDQTRLKDLQWAYFKIAEQDRRKTKAKGKNDK